MLVILLVAVVLANVGMGIAAYRHNVRFDARRREACEPSSLRGEDGDSLSGWGL